jgi:hypothetical protein
VPLPLNALLLMVLEAVPFVVLAITAAAAAVAPSSLLVNCAILSASSRFSFRKAPASSCEGDQPGETQR